MAHHGGRTVPRAHRPRAPTMSVQQAAPPAHPLTAPLAPLRPVPPPPPPASVPVPSQPPSSLSPVTLQAPRPDAERSCNEYVETPFRAANAAAIATVELDKAHTATPNAALQRSFERPSRLPLVPIVPVGPRTITKQPVAFTKDHPAASHLASSAAAAGDCPAANAAANNIICSECGRCRCESCRAPRPLPQRWLCDNACLCSADAVIDYASCLCCVKALYYHCSESDAGATCADEPCSCAPHRRAARWACLGALTAALPCLLCYWPLRGCQRAVEAAYARHSRAGCRCRPHLATPEKRLLDSTPDF